MPRCNLQALFQEIRIEYSIKYILAEENQNDRRYFICYDTVIACTLFTLSYARMKIDRSVYKVAGPTSGHTL